MSDDIGDIYLIAAGEVWINGGGADGAVETIASQLRRNAHMQGVAQSLQSQLAAANERCAELTGLGDKVNAIRNSIIGAQSFNFSEHAYPLVAALNEAGFVGLPYPEAKENLGMLIDQLAAERERADGLQKIVDAARAQKPYAYEHGVGNGDGTFSVHITRGDMEQTGPTSYAYSPPKNPHKEWPVKPLYASVPAPAVVPDDVSARLRYARDILLATDDEVAHSAASTLSGRATIRDAAAIIAASQPQAAQAVATVAVPDDEPEWPDYHEQGMGCGLEDRGITDRYDACRHGWVDGVEACQRAFDNWRATQPQAAQAAADDLRSAGLLVAVHNDYLMHGNQYTFWLFVDRSGMSYKGEGLTDADALNQVRAVLAASRREGAE